MKFDLNPEDQLKAEEFVAAGHYSSVSEVVHAGLQALARAELAIRWTPAMEERIEEGLRAQARGDFASDKDIDALFDKYVLKSA